MERLVDLLERLRLRHPTNTIIEDTLSHIRHPNPSWSLIGENLRVDGVEDEEFLSKDKIAEWLGGQ